MNERAFESLPMYKIWVFGFDYPLWATEKQALAIINCANSQDSRQNLLKLGSYVFKASSVSRMHQVTTQRYNIPAYATRKYDEEINDLQVF